jgi:hypothetical protein
MPTALRSASMAACTDHGVMWLRDTEGWGV